jgi:hypothetical protein
VNACAFVPKYAAKEPSKEKYDLVTKILTLDLTNINVHCGVRPKTIFSCLVGAGVVVPLSGVISGSIVLVGNTLHWAEKTLSCSEI